ncbi:Uncharacterized protein dnm_041160 [Desulfonema magnum]|uniref:Uncharacterized protein n=1 Tax=Desulfonema magnum TaxID=45655 RepID=A0A975GNK6_9BACT|nr:Uncharacterized protein dnm_041160 [Desulfonema magnum]
MGNIQSAEYMISQSQQAMAFGAIDKLQITTHKCMLKKIICLNTVI